MEEFHVTPDDLSAMDTVGTVSSYQDGDAAPFTRLSVFHRTGYQRPFVAVVEAFGPVRDANPFVYSRTAFKFAAVGTLRRALDWFDDSGLAHTLDAVCQGWTPPAGRTRFYEGDATLTGALAWLYPGVQEREGRSIGRALLMSEDFGMPQRTVNSAIALERNGDVPGPWVAPFVRAMRHFDRAAWVADKEQVRG